MIEAEAKCAWCNAGLSAGHAGIDERIVSHGICLDCIVREFKVAFESVDTLTAEQLDELPIGIIMLDREGKIVQYNRTESELSHRAAKSVIGRDYFLEVAPCAAVREFKGQFDDLIAHGAGERRFSFVFAFPGRRAYVEVRLTMTSESSKVCAIVKKIAEVPAA